MMLKSVLLFFALSLGLGVLPNTMLSFAEGKTETSAKQDQTKTDLESRNGIFEVLTKIVYVVLWPLIALAGLAMDNQLVYGSFMYLDAPLRKVRNIVKNLANFFLGFIFLAGILIYAISPEKKMERGVIKGFSTPAALIKKTLIAGVLIQLSRFIMMVLVDISTILTYTVGTIPTTVLSSTDQTSNYKVMGMSLELNMGDAGKDANSAKNEAVQRYATLPGDKATLNIAPCESAKRKEDEKEKIYLLGRKYDSLGKGKDMAVGYCTYLGALVSYQEIEIQVANNAS
ncbi:MAG: hypothetical protein Q4B28_02795 [bacterium]|nr:hypothetical protein [bacterium]